jgi:photosystem II stability/assembly factor-like uncharacterized protein
MKRLKLFLLLITFTTLGYFNSLNAQWYEKSDGLPSNWGAWAIDAYDSLIAVGPIANDSLYITTDGGNHWYPRYLPSGVDDICIIGSEKIWFCNGWGEIYATNDGGFNWQLQFYDTSMTKFMNYIEMFDSLNGVAMGDAPSNEKPALFLRTKDGGNNWISMNDSSLIGLWSGDVWRRVDFINANIGYFFSFGESPPKLYKTTNSGKNWRMVNDTLSCQVLKFYNANFGIIKASECIGGQCTPGIHRTTDGGETWEVMINDYWGWGDDIEFLPESPRNIWCVVDDRVFVSSDSGKTWTEQIQIDGVFFWDIVFTEDKCGWLLGTHKIFRTTNGGIGGIVSVEKQNYKLPPSVCILEQNFPNPFNPTTKIKYQIPELSFVTIKVYDVLGNKIATLVNEEKTAGTYEITWYAENLPSGVYFYRLQAGDFVETKKMVFLK